MVNSIVGRIGLCAIPMLLASRGHAAGDPWRAAEQPELKQALEQAPVLQAESLGAPARGMNVWERWMVPNPDGFVWTYQKDVLVRIDPNDVSVHVVGRVAPVGYPTFVGKDIYLSGSEQLRRIRNVVPASSSEGSQQ